ncbi:MAG: SPOR domain-containing protein, partial [Pseudomonadota bacterium]|nr:SPOR domain-containing protein [Pseudomonadota bacterium]
NPPAAASQPRPKPALAKSASERKAVAEPKEEPNTPDPSNGRAKKAQPSKKEAQAKQDEARKLDSPKKEAQAKKEDPKKPESSKKEAQAKKDEPANKAGAKEQSAKKEPSRHWVQVAGGANKSGLPKEFARLQGKAPKLLGGRSAWTTPLRFTNRLLVGPFKTEKEAQAFVNELNKLDFTAFSWTNPAGQEIEKLSVK